MRWQQGEEKDVGFRVMLEGGNLFSNLVLNPVTVLVLIASRMEHTVLRNHLPSPPRKKETQGVDKLE